MKTTIFKLSQCALAVSSLLCASTVLAQTNQAEAKKDVERIQITGSNIKRTDLEGPSPVTVITRDLIDKSGFDNLAQLDRKSVV